MATVNALITSPTPLVNTSISSGGGQQTISTSTYTNNTGKYLLVIATARRSMAPLAYNSPCMFFYFNLNAGGGATAYTISCSVPLMAGNNPFQMSASATFVLAPGQGFSAQSGHYSPIESFNSNTSMVCEFKGYSLSPEF